MADKILSRGDRRKIMIDHIDAKKRDIDLRFGDKIDAAAATDEQKKQIRLDILRARNTADLYISGIEQKILHPMYYQAQDRAELRDELTHSLGGREFLDNLGVKIRDYEDKNQTAQIDAYFENIVAAILAAENPAERMSEWAKTTYKNATLHHDFLREMIRDGLMMREKSRSVFPGRLAEETTIWVELENPILPEQAKSYNLFREITDAADIKITQRQNEKGIFYIDYEIGTLKKTEKLKTIVDAAGWLAKNTDDDRGEENGVDYNDIEFWGAVRDGVHNPADIVRLMNELQKKRGAEMKGKGHYRNQFLVSALRKNPVLAAHLCAEMRNNGFNGEKPGLHFLEAVADLRRKYEPYAEYLERESGAGGRGRLDSIDYLVFSAAPFAVASQSTYQDWQNCMFGRKGVLNAHRIKDDIAMGVIACYGRSKNDPMHNIFNMATYQLHEEKTGRTIYQTSTQSYGKSFDNLHGIVRDAFDRAFDIPGEIPYGYYQTDPDQIGSLYSEGIRDDFLSIKNPGDYRRALADEYISADDLIAKMGEMEPDELRAEYDGLMELLNDSEIQPRTAFNAMAAGRPAADEFQELAKLMRTRALAALEKGQAAVSDINTLFGAGNAASVSFASENIDKVISALSEMSRNERYDANDAVSLMKNMRNLGQIGNAERLALMDPIIRALGDVEKYGYRIQLFDLPSRDFGIVARARPDGAAKMFRKDPGSARHWASEAMRSPHFEDYAGLEELIVSALQGYSAIEILLSPNIDKSEKISAAVAKLAKKELADASRDRLIELVEHKTKTKAANEFARQNRRAILARLDQMLAAEPVAENTALRDETAMLRAAELPAAAARIKDAILSGRANHDGIYGALCECPTLRWDARDADGVIRALRGAMAEESKDPGHMFNQFVETDRDGKISLREWRLTESAKEIVRNYLAEKIALGLETDETDEAMSPALSHDAAPKILGRFIARLDADAALAALPRAAEYIKNKRIYMSPDLANELSGKAAIAAARLVMSGDDWKYAGMHYKQMTGDDVRRDPELIKKALENHIGDNAFMDVFKAIPKDVRAKYASYGIRHAAKYAANLARIGRTIVFRGEKDLKYFDITNDDVDEFLTDKKKAVKGALAKASEKIKSKLPGRGRPPEKQND